MFIRDLGDLFAANNLAVKGQTLFVSTVPILPDSGPAILLVLATGGVGPVFIQNERMPAFILPGAQVRAIGPDWLDAYELIWRAYRLVVTVRNEILSNSYYRCIHVTQEPFDLGMDATTGRVQIAFNMIGDLNPEELPPPPVMDMTTFQYNYSTNTTAPPTGNQIRMDAAAPYASVSKLWIPYMTSDGIDVFWALMGHKVGDQLYFQDKNDHTLYLQLSVLSDPVDKGTYVELGVGFVTGAGALLNSQAVLLVTRQSLSTH